MWQFNYVNLYEVTICPAAGQLFGKTKCPAVFLRMSFSGSGYISSINLVFNGNFRLAAVAQWSRSRAFGLCVWVWARLRAFLLYFFFLLNFLDTFFLIFLYLFLLKLFSLTTLTHWDCIYFTKFS